MLKTRLEKFVKQGLSTRRIAKETGKGQTSVRYWLEKHGLKTSPKPKPRRCGTCGESDESKFYGAKRRVCSSCHNEYTIRKAKEKKQRAVEHKGGKCQRCGYNKCIRALEFHHGDPKSKDPNFTTMRGWAWERVLVELKKCELVCANCHRELH